MFSVNSCVGPVGRRVSTVPQKFPRATSCWCAVLPEADAEAPANTSVARRKWGGGWIPVLTWAATFVIKFCEANEKRIRR